MRAGALVAKDEVIAEWSGHAAAVRTKLMGLPNVLDIDDATRSALEARIREVLEELADGNDEPMAEKAPARVKRGKGRASRKRTSKRKAKRKAKRKPTRKGAARK